jgi:hypothetical protein
MSRIRTSLTALLLLTALASLVHARTWKDSTGGFSVEAELLQVTAGVVHLKKANGNVIQVPLERLSAADQAFAKSQATAEPPMKVARGNLKGPLLSNVQLVNSSIDPPSITFTADIDVAPKAHVAELWGTVDLEEGHKIVDVVAGAVFKGLLRMEIDGVDLLNPPPGTKLQRATFTGAEGAKHTCELKFPEVTVAGATTTVVLLASDDSGEKGNVIKFTIDLRSGKVVKGNVKSKP